MWWWGDVVMRSCDMRDARSRMCSDDACERRSGRCTLMVAAWCFCRGAVGDGICWAGQ